MNHKSPIDLSGNSIIEQIKQQRELLIVLGVIAVITLMIVPLPTWMMDFLLSVNIVIALIILLVSMYNKEALDFSVFPSLLLTVTLFRLSLNIATTRLILSKGDAGNVVEVFGTFVSGNNPVVGVIIFIIIVLIQFMVITKGAGRIAEVAARFTLDAMPGKQMAIDADLNAGMITEDQAKERRAKISRESDFYGAMDGASKFVKGDAIAGIIITLINILGGFVIGMMQMGLTMTEALARFTSLTIGDGLVSQIPALMISTGTGILVSRAASKDSLGTEVSNQLFSNHKVLWVASAVMIMFSFIPGLPKPIFIALASMLAISGWVTYQNSVNPPEEVTPEGDEAEGSDEPTEDKVEDYLLVDALELEIGYGLISIVDASQGGDLLERIQQIRKQLATQMGFIIPPVRIRDNMQLEPNEYVIKIRTVKVAEGELMSGSYLAMNPGMISEEIRGIETIEPAFNLPALWITESQKDHAELCGYTVVELPAVLATHLTEVIKAHADELLTRQDAQELVDNIKEANNAVIDELIPSILTLGEVHRVLQNLLGEQVSIRDLPQILEVLNNVGRSNKNSDILTEYVRNALAPHICDNLKSDEGVIQVITIDPNLESLLEGALQEFDGGVKLNLSPTDSGAVLEAINRSVEEVKADGEMPIMVVSPVIRQQIKRLSAASNPELIVLSYNEIINGVELQSINMVVLEQPEIEEEGEVLNAN